MPMEPEIRWGANYDNALPFSYPQVADNVKSWRRPVPGSRRTRNRAGVTDAWISAWDYMLGLSSRWFNRQTWPLLQDFLKHAGEGNTFRFIPDSRYPAFYVDGCYLDEPFENPEPSLEETDGSQSIDMAIRQQAVDFSVAKRGLMFEYSPGKAIADIGGTHSRADASTCATYIDRDGVVKTVAANVLRDAHFIGGIRHTLLELERINGFTHSEDLSNAAYGKNDCSISANATTAPDGAATMDKIVENSANAIHYVNRVDQAVTDNTVSSASGFLKAGERTRVQIHCYGKSGAAVGTLDINLSTGAIISQAGFARTPRIVPCAKYGAYRFEASWDVGAGANTVGYAIVLHNGTGTTYAGDGASGVYAWGLQFEPDKSCPSSYIATAASTKTRAADQLSFTLSPAPQPLTVYAKVTELGTITIPNARLWQIGKSDDTLPRMLCYRNSAVARYFTFHQQAGGNSEVDPGGTINIGDTVETLSGLSAAGAPSASVTVNAGAESIGTPGAANALGTAWSDTKLWLNSVGTIQPGVQAFQMVRIMAGVQSLATIRAA